RQGRCRRDEVTVAHLPLLASALEQLGWKEGRSVRIDYRFAPASTLARSPTTEDARRLLRHVGTGLGDLAILNRGCAGDADGPDNLAIRDEQNAALQRRGSA